MSSRAPEPVRWPLAVPISQRAGGAAQDAYLLNSFVERVNDGSGRAYVCKRPGTTLAFTYGGGGAATVQAVLGYKGFLMAVAGDTVYNVQAPVTNNHPTGTAFTQTNNGSWAARYTFGCVVFKNKIWVVGGRDAGVNVFNDVWYSEDGETWTQAVSAAPWTRRQAAELVVFNDRMYLIGGIDGPGTYRNDVWVTDDGVTWSQLTTSGAFAGRAGHRACAFNNGIMLMGGVNAGGFLNDVWFSTDGTNWVQQIVNAAWAVRSDFMLLPFGTKMYVGGGLNGGGTLNDMYSSPDGITWTLESAAPWSNALYAMGACVLDGKMWVLGGTNNAGTYFNDVYSTTSGTGAWTAVSTAPGFGNRAKFGCVAFRSPVGVSAIRTPTIWVIGGDAVGALQEVWRANINGANNSTWTLPTPGSNLPVDSCTCNGQDFLVLKDTSGMAVLWGNALTQVTDKNYPPVTVRGVVNLDETVYVMDPTGLIYGSQVEEPRVYPSFNFIGADYESDEGVAITKYRNYLVAFGKFTTQMFYNSGVGPNLLRPVQNANCKIGCAYADSVATMKDNVFWVGRDKESQAIAVYRFQGLSPLQISDPFIERLLFDPPGFITNIKGSCRTVGGHSFYILTLVGIGASYVFDLTTGLWHKWDSFGGANWATNFTATNNGIDYEAPDALRVIYSTSLLYGSDAGTSIVQQGRTNIIDGGTDLFKFCGRTVVIGDKGTHTVNLEFTDDDYATYVSMGPISMALESPAVTQCGRFRRRAWRWTIFGNTIGNRLEALEGYIDVGNH